MTSNEINSTLGSRVHLMNRIVYLNCLALFTLLTLLLLTLYTVSRFPGNTGAKISLYIQSIHYSSSYSQQRLVVIILCW